MLKNYFKIAIRNLIKHKKYSIINILGLSIGLACFILIMLWVQDELSYDKFHKNADNIYIVFRSDNDKLSGATAKPLAAALKDELPEVSNATSFVPLPESFKPYLQYEDNGFEEKIALAEPQFFEIFSFDFAHGNPKDAFINPNSIIITEKMKEKYFGDKNAMGESLSFTFLGLKKNLKVTGILKNIPHNSSIQTEFFIPIDYIKSYGVNWDTWSSQSPQTYILTQGPFNVNNLESKILECKQNHFNEKNISYSLLPLEKIHLHTSDIGFFNSSGDIKYIYIFSIFAGIILLIACMNYINLSNAFSLKRTREIGIKKVVGATRNRLTLQYFGETFLLTIIALIFALLIVELLLPVLNQLTGKSLFVNLSDLEFLTALGVVTLLTSIISGLYPALFITRIQTIQILKGKFAGHTNRINLHKGLLIFQFALSIIIIISTVIVFNQLNFIKNTNLGYDKENVLCVRVRGDIQSRYNSFKNEMVSNTNILSISRSEGLDATTLGKTEGINWPGKKGKFSTWLLHVDSDFAKTYKIEMKEGRFYSDQYPSDATNAFVINETAQKEMGLKSPIGQELVVWGRKGNIVGVTKDFHFSSLHHKIEPLVLRIPNPNEKNMYYRELSIRLKPYSIKESLAFIESSWHSFFPDEPFDYYFIDENLNANYSAEQNMSDIFKYFSFLAIFIACLGLYGLTAFMIERKIKDIGIHKVLGANIMDISFLLSKKYLLWIILSNIIAWPITYYAMNTWLQDFAYRVDLTIWPFLFAGLAALVIALVTVSFQVINAARTNPVVSLKCE